MGKVKVFFINLGAWFRALTWAKVWNGIKKAVKYLWLKFCDFLKWRFAPSVTVMLLGVHVALNSSKIGGTIIFMAGVWFLIQEAYRK